MTEVFARFPNLSAAGRKLAPALDTAAMGQDVVVLGIVSAGVPVAVEVAKHLEAPLDLVTIRRLLAPRGPGSQACAVNVGGILVIDDEIGPRSASPQTPFDFFLEDALFRLEQRAQICRGNRPSINLTGKPVLLVDCAIRTGLTLQAAVTAVRTLEPARITVAVPVTSHDGRLIVEQLADDFIYLAAPEPFGNAGVWYKDFSRLADNEIGGVL